jgi:hypothetical protein
LTTKPVVAPSADVMVTASCTVVVVFTGVVTTDTVTVVAPRASIWLAISTAVEFTGPPAPDTTADTPVRAGPVQSRVGG